MNTPPRGTGDITPMPSPDPNGVQEESMEQTDPPVTELKSENSQEQLPSSEQSSDNNNVTDPMGVEFFIGEARKNCSNYPPGEQPPNLYSIQPPQMNDAYSLFKNKFVEEHFYAMQAAGNADVSLEFNLTESEVQQVNNRLKAVFSTTKSPIQILNELFPGSQKVKIIDKGCYGQSHDPMHITCAYIENVGSFLGKAKSKQDAKQFAARMAIGFLNQLKFAYEQSGLCPVFNKLKPMLNNSPNNNKYKKVKTIKPQPQTPVFQPVFQQQQQQSPASNGESPIAKQNIEAVIDQDLSSKAIEEFSIDYNRSHGVDRSSLLDNELSKAVYNTVMEKASELFGPDSINQLIENTPCSGTKAQYISQDLWRWKELAGFVLVSDIDQSIQVLSLGTGTKCISGEYLSLNGDVVHDCHAEIIARRGLMCVLYEQLEALLENQLQDKPEFILEPRENNQGFRLKKHLKLHLYISSPPCGDARLFNFVENKNSRNRFVRGILRVKVEKGQGAIPMPLNYIATWDGILTSCQRCSIMSCSDKITLWNVVGVQGSLLSFFLEPIYIESVIVSRLFRPQHILRALCGRVIEDTFKENIGENSLYHLNKVKLGFFNRSNSESKDTNLNPVFAHNWHTSFNVNCLQPYKQVEMIKAEIGMNFLTETESRLCKHQLLKRFQHLISNHSNIPSIIPYNLKQELEEPANLTEQLDEGTKRLVNDIKNNTYAGLKNGSHLYKKAKIALFTTLKASGLGSWVTTPVDVDMFHLDSE